MFTLSGAAWSLFMFLFPNIFGFAVLVFVALISVVGYMLFGSEPEGQRNFRGYWRVLWPSGLSVIVGQYAGMILSLILAFVLSGTIVGAVNSEFPLTAPGDLTVNLIYVVFTCVLCAALSFVGGYWIALKKRIPQAGKRLGFCLVNSIAFGVALFMGLVLSNMLMI